MTGDDHQDFLRRHRAMWFGHAMRYPQLCTLAAIVPESMAIGMFAADHQIRIGQLQPPARATPMKRKR